MPVATPILLSLLCLTIAWFDLYARRVPNGLLLLCLVIQLFALGFAQPTPESSLAGHALGLAVGLLVLLPLYVLGWMGAGDVKFFAVLGFFLGVTPLLPIWIIASLLAGLHALILIGMRHYLQPLHVLQKLLTQWQGSHWGQHVMQARAGRQGLPYATYLAIAALMVIHYPITL
ncbi:MAG: A24 family peptidase [Dyella sp.]